MPRGSMKHERQQGQQKTNTAKGGLTDPILTYFLQQVALVTAKTTRQQKVFRGN
jgi:hypothetical protein